MHFSHNRRSISTKVFCVPFDASDILRIDGDKEEMRTFWQYSHETTRVLLSKSEMRKNIWGKGKTRIAIFHIFVICCEENEDK